MKQNKKNIKQKSKTASKTTSKTKQKKTPMNQKKKKSIKDQVFNKENILFYIFIALIIIVIFLSASVYKASQNTEVKANLSIPIYKEGLSEEFDISLKELSHKKNYSIKIRNYRSKKINDKEYSYEIVVVNDTDSKIKITKDEDVNNLMIDQQSTKIEGVSLKPNIKDEHIYFISVENKKNIKKDDKIHIEINS